MAFERGDAWISNEVWKVDFYRQVAWKNILWPFTLFSPRNAATQKLYSCHFEKVFPLGVHEDVQLGVSFSIIFATYMQLMTCYL